MGLTSLNQGAISFKKLSGKAHTQQNFAVTEEGISTNVQSSYSTVFANPIESLPVTNSGLTALYSTNGIVERIKFEVDIIPDTQIAVGRSQGYRLKLPSDYNTSGILFPEFSAGTYLHTALGKLQIVPSVLGKLKIDGTTEYDPILYQTNGSTVIPKFDAINWYIDPYDGVLFVQDPPSGFDSSSSRPAFVEAFLYVGDYLDNIIFNINSGSTNFGLSKQIPFINSSNNNFQYSNNLTYDLTKNTFNVSSGLVTSGAGTFSDNFYIGLNHTNISGTGNFNRWNFLIGDTNSALNNGTGVGTTIQDCFLIGEENTMHNEGTNGKRIHDSFIVAYDGTIHIPSGATNVDIFSSGIYGGEDNLIEPVNLSLVSNIVVGGFGNDLTPKQVLGTGGAVGNFILGGNNNLNDGQGAGAMGYFSQSSGVFSLVHGFVTTYGTGGLVPSHSGVVPRILAKGKHSINISANSTGQTSGHGTLSDYSAILGGFDHNIPTGSTNTIILGGQGIKARSGDSNQVYVPNLNIASTPSSGSTSDGILVRNSTTGQIKIRSANAIGIAGLDKQVQFNDNGVFGATANFVYDKVNKNLFFQDTPNTINGTPNNTFVLGEAMIINGSPSAGGHVTDCLVVGFGNTIGDNINRFSGSEAFSYGSNGFNFGLSSMTGGRNGRVLQGNQPNGALFRVGGIAIGLGDASGSISSEPVTSDSGSVNISTNTAAQTVGHGSYGNLSVILGGRNHNIPQTSPRSVILGGDAIKARSGDSDQVYIPNLNIVSTPVSGSTSDGILVRNSSTGQIKIRNASAFNIGGSNKSLQFNDNGVFGGDNFLTYDKNNVLLIQAENLTFLGSAATIDHTFISGFGHTLNRGALAPFNRGIEQAGIFGFGNTIGDGTNRFTAQNSFTFGYNNFNFAVGSLVGGNAARTLFSDIFSGGIAFGLNGLGDGIEPVTAKGRAVNISRNSTGQTIGHGAYGDLSVIIGGQDHNIPSTSLRNVILGGNAIKARSGTSDQVYVPNFNIVSTPTNDNAQTSLLVRDPSTGLIKTRTVSSLSGLTNFGLSKQIPFINSSNNNFQYSNNLNYDISNNTFRVGNNISITVTGSTNNDNFYLGNDHTIKATSGTRFRWNYVFGDTNVLTVSGGSGSDIEDSFVFGDNHRLINGGSAGKRIHDHSIIGSFHNTTHITTGANLDIFGGGHFGGSENLIEPTLSTVEEVTIGGYGNTLKSRNLLGGGGSVGSFILGGNNNLNDGQGAGAMGYFSQSSGIFSLVHGYVTTYSSGGLIPTHIGIVPRVLASGKHSVNISANSTGQTSGHGALSDYSVILGGFDHNIPTGSTNTIILGGQGIKARSGDSNQVYVPNFNIVSTPTNDNAQTSLLVRDSSTGSIKTRAFSSFAINGLNTTSGNIELGGVLTKATKLTGGFSLTLGGTGGFAGGTRFTSLDINTSATSNWGMGDGVNISTANTQAFLSVLGNDGIFLKGGASGEVSLKLNILAPHEFLLTDNRLGSDATGIEYAANYAANYTVRSLVDKGYVDTVVSGLTFVAIKSISANTTILLNDYLILVNTSSSGLTVNLPLSPTDGKVFKVKDKSNNASVNNITINGNGHNIDGVSTATINTNKGFMELTYSSSDSSWFITG